MARRLADLTEDIAYRVLVREDGIVERQTLHRLLDADGVVVGYYAPPDRRALNPDDDDSNEPEAVRDIIAAARTPGRIARFRAAEARARARDERAGGGRP